MDVVIIIIIIIIMAVALSTDIEALCHIFPCSLELICALHRIQLINHVFTLFLLYLSYSDDLRLLCPETVSLATDGY
jgi:hypothetical protein